MSFFPTKSLVATFDVGHYAITLRKRFQCTSRTLAWMGSGLDFKDIALKGSI